MNNNTLRQTFTVGQRYGQLPIAIREGYRFIGWFTQRAGGVRVTVDTPADEAVTELWARWERVGPLSFSSRGYMMLAHMELPYDGRNIPLGIFVHENDAPVGIYPYNVHDFGITLGFGHHVPWTAIHGTDGQREHWRSVMQRELLERYGVLDKITNIGNPNNLLPVPVIRTDGGTPRFMSIQDAWDLMAIDVERFSGDLIKFLNGEEEGWRHQGIAVTQHEFDALIFRMYLRGGIGTIARGLLMNGNRNPNDWEAVFLLSPTDTRGLRSMNLFFNGEYSYIESQVIRP